MKDSSKSDNEATMTPENSGGDFGFQMKAQSLVRVVTGLPTANSYLP